MEREKGERETGRERGRVRERKKDGERDTHTLADQLLL